MVDKRFAQTVLWGATRDYTHCIVYCDHFDYTLGIKFVRKGEDVHTIINNIRGNQLCSLMSIDMVYNYNLPLLKQLNETPYNIEPLTKPNNLNKPHGGLYNISERITEAIEYTSSIHKNQIDHNLRLMELVIDNKASKNIELLLICSCLHDTIRNTQDLYNIYQQFGPTVTSILLEITPSNILSNIFNQEIKESTRIEKISNWALTILLCDYLDTINHNLTDSYYNETLNLLNIIINNRNLTQSQIRIIKEIISKLFKHTEGNNEQEIKIAKLANKHKELKEYFKEEIKRILRNKNIIIPKDNPENSAITLLLKHLRSTT